MTQIPVRKQRCANCCYGSSGLLQSSFPCRRFPPTVYGHGWWSKFPTVGRNDWCGEWSDTPRSSPTAGEKENVAAE